MNWILLAIGIYLGLGYATYRYIERLLNVKHAKAFNQQDKQDYDAFISFVIVLLLWPKIMIPWLAKAWKHRND